MKGCIGVALTLMVPNIPIVLSEECSYKGTTYIVFNDLDLDYFDSMEISRVWANGILIFDKEEEYIEFRL